MKRTKRSLAITWLTCSALVLSLCSGILITENATAAPKHDERPARQRKVAADLQQQVLNGSDETVQVILQLNGDVSKELAALLKSNGIKIKKHFSNFNSFAIDLPTSVVEHLSTFPEVDFVSHDSAIEMLGHLSSTTGADDVRQQSNSSGSSYTLDGSGIGIAVLDSGVSASHKSLADAAGRSRVVYSQDFTGQNRVDDPFGHGTFVAGIAAGSSSIYRSDYTGVASNAKIINLRVLDSLGRGSVSGVLAALDWVMSNRLIYNVKVVNLSLGAPAVSTYTSDPLCKSVRRLVDAGLVVVAAAGNDGKDANGQKLYGAIHAPGNEPSAITVGATNTFGTNSRSDDQVATYSSNGPTRSYWTDQTGLKHYDNFLKPDIVAPGNKLISAEALNNYLVTQNPSLETGLGSHKADQQMMYLSGTSAAAPAAAGAAALLLQANPQLTPNMVKMILMYTAQQLPGFNTLQQGAGALNIEGAIRLAKLVRTNLPVTPGLGTQLLTTSTGPVSQSTIDGTTFQWAQGIILDQTFARGSDLITKYQKIYGRGVLLSDGTLLSDGVLMSDSTMMSSGVLLSDNILTSSGVLMSDGYFFLSCGVLLGDGVLLADGVLIGDGRVVSDGVLLSDGVLMGDGVLLGDVRAKAWQAMINGD